MIAGPAKGPAVLHLVPIWSRGGSSWIHIDVFFPTLTLGLLGLTLLIVQPAALLAAEPEDSKDDTKVIIIEHDGDEVIIEMEEVQAIVDEAMEGLDEVMAELQDMQLEVRLGKDNNLNLSYEDTTFELDLDQILTQVAAAVQVGFDQVHTEDWTHSQRPVDDVSEDDLRQRTGRSAEGNEGTAPGTPEDQGFGRGLTAALFPETG